MQFVDRSFPVPSRELYDQGILDDNYLHCSTWKPAIKRDDPLANVFSCCKLSMRLNRDNCIHCDVHTYIYHDFLGCNFPYFIRGRHDYLSNYREHDHIFHSQIAFKTPTGWRHLRLCDLLSLSTPDYCVTRSGRPFGASWRL